MITKIIGIGITLFVSWLGGLVGGYAQDQIWLSSNELLPNCETNSDGSKMTSGWKDVCLEHYKEYFQGKSMISSIGWIIPLAIGIGLIAKML